MSVYHLDLQYGVSGLIESNWIGTAYGLPSATPADLDFWFLLSRGPPLSVMNTLVNVGKVLPKWKELYGS